MVTQSFHSKQINSKSYHFYRWLAALISRWDSRFGGCRLLKHPDIVPDLHMGYLDYFIPNSWNVNSKWQEFQSTKKTLRKMKNVKSQILFCWSNTWSIRPGNTQQSSTVNVSTSYFTKNPKFETFDFSFFFTFSLYFEILVILRCFPQIYREIWNVSHM